MYPIRPFGSWLCGAVKPVYHTIQRANINLRVNMPLTCFREIIDESDVFIDVHKAIRRMTPAPRTRVPKGAIVSDSADHKLEGGAGAGATDSGHDGDGARKPSASELSGSPKVSTFMVRRRSSGHNGAVDKSAITVPLRSDDPEIKEHLKHLGPSNAATRPKSTRINTVKIKPGLQSSIPPAIPEGTQKPQDGAVITPSHAPHGGIGEGLLENAGREASDGVHSLAVGYGTISPSPNADRISWKSGKSGRKNIEDDPTSPRSQPADETTKLIIEPGSGSRQRTKSTSTIGSLPSAPSLSHSPPRKRHTARSGSISENIVDFNGVRKIVLETTSSSDSEPNPTGQIDGADEQQHAPETDGKAEEKKKKKRKKRGKKKKTGGESSESQPLLGGGGS